MVIEIYHAYELSINVASIMAFVFLLILMSRAAGQDEKMKHLFRYMLTAGILANIVYAINIIADLQSSIRMQLVVLVVMMIIDIAYSHAMYRYMLVFFEYKRVPITREQERTYWFLFALMMVVSYVEILIFGLYGYNDWLSEAIRWMPTIAYNIYVYRFVFRRRSELDNSAVRGWTYVLFLPITLVLLLNWLIPKLDTSMLMFVLFSPILYIAVQAQDANLVTRGLQETNEELKERDELQQIISALSYEYATVIGFDIRDDASMKIYKLHERVAESMGPILIGRSYSEAQDLLVKMIVHDDDRDMVSEKANLESIRSEMAWPESRTLTYRNVMDHYGEEKIVRIDEHMVVIGFADKDEEIRRKMSLDEEVNLQKMLIEGLSQAYDSVWYLDPQTHSVKIIGGDMQSETGKSLTEQIEEEDLQKNLRDFAMNNIVEEDRQRVFTEMNMEWLKENVEPGKPHVINYAFNDENGEKHYIQATIVKELDQAGDTHLAVALRITDEEIRAELKKQEEQQRHLAEALSMAEAASRAKSDFLSNMSHDIRTPMNAIIGFSTIAAAHVEEPNLMTDYLGKITTASKHLLSLINDVLDMSRIESGRVSLDEKKNSLPDILHTLRSVVQSGVSAKNLEFYLDSEDVEHEAVICDELRVNQVLLNCMSNAIKYTMPGGTVALKIIERPSTLSGWSNFIFKIRDTGIGMSPEFAEHVFDTFAREENSTVSRIEGTGLGMAITKNIVDMMNGSISVKSEKGKGTEFTIELPMKINEEDVETRDTSILQGLRALVADDDMDTCRSVVTMLDNIGMHGEWSTSGKDAVERAKFAHNRNEEFHAYIIDWMMPDLNGIEVVRRIRAAIGTDMPIYILTAYDWADIEIEAKEAGVTAILEKPIFRSDLEKLLLDAREELMGIERKKKEPDMLDSDMKQFESKRVMLVEDIDVNREILKALLDKTGIVFDEAENGQVALNKLRDAEPGRYDLVLMDIQMPIMDGLEATKAIRSSEQEWLMELPIIAMTANAFLEDQERAADAGMNDYLTKPIEVPELFAKLNKYLG